MARWQRLASAALAASTILGSVAANTLVVDDDGGPGVDYTTLIDAVAAASNGDVIVVREGNYPQDVSTSKSLTILGSGFQTRLEAKLTLRNLPRGREVRLSGFYVESLTIESCLGPVLGTNLDVGDNSLQRGGTVVIGSANVRLCKSSFHGTNLLPAVLVDSSRAEFTSCSLFGGDGANGLPTQNPQPGTEGLVTDNRAIVSVADCGISAGDGGWHGSASTLAGAAGGTGMLVRSTSRVLLSGGGIAGGSGGLGTDFDFDGAGGDGVRNFGWISRSNTAFVYGFGGFDNDGYEYVGPGVLVNVDPPHPLLEIEGEFRTTGWVHVHVHGAVGDDVTLLIGENATVGTQIGAENALLLEVDRSVPIGTIPASGELDLLFDLPPGTAAGDLVALQAQVATVNGDRLTNSAPLVIR